MKLIAVAFIALAVTFASKAQTNSIRIQSDFKNIATYDSRRQTGYEVFTNYKSSVVIGSQFLTDGWSAGMVKTTNNEELKGNYQVSFDKVRQELFIRSKDTNNIILADKSKIASFTIVSEQPRTFVPASKYDAANKNFFELLTEGKNYTLLKEITTTFEKANSGDLSKVMMGKNQDTFTDHIAYFIYHNNKLHKIKLNEGNICKALKEDASKVNEYFAQHPTETLQETDVIGLVQYLN